MLASSNIRCRVQGLPAPQRVAAAEPSQLLARLIARSAVISRDDFNEAREIAACLGLSIEQVFVSSGFMSQWQVDTFLKAIAFVDGQLCNESLAASAICLACRKRISFEEGLRYFGWGW